MPKIRPPASTHWPRAEPIVPDGDPKADEANRGQAASCTSLQPQDKAAYESALVTSTSQHAVQQQLLAAQLHRAAASRPVQPSQEHTGCKQTAS